MTRVSGPPGWAVPDSTSLEFRPKGARYCLCVFVINEGAKIAAQLERLRVIAGDIDVIIADGGSTDGSLAPDRLRACGVRALLIKRGAGRLSAQMRMAFAYAIEQGYEGVVTMDGNNKDDPDAVAAFVRDLNAGFDHLQGSRFIPGGAGIRTPWLRLVGVRALHAPLLSRAAGFPYTDTTNGFRAYSRRLLLDPRVAPFRDVFTDYELHYYLAIRAPRLGFRVKEVPVTRRYPERGRTPTKITPIRGNWRVLRTLVRACRHQFDPPEGANA